MPTQSGTLPMKLKNLEDIILGAEDKLFSLEYDLFCDVRDQTQEK